MALLVAEYHQRVHCGVMSFALNGLLLTAYGSLLWMLNGILSDLLSEVYNVFALHNALVICCIINSLVNICLKVNNLEKVGNCTCVQWDPQLTTRPDFHRFLAALKGGLLYLETKKSNGS